MPVNEFFENFMFIETLISSPPLHTHIHTPEKCLRAHMIEAKLSKGNKNS